MMAAAPLAVTDEQRAGPLDRQPDIRGDEPMPFGADVPVDATVPATDRLAGFMGRPPVGRLTRRPSRVHPGCAPPARGGRDRVGRYASTTARPWSARLRGSTPVGVTTTMSSSRMPYLPGR